MNAQPTMLAALVRSLRRRCSIRIGLELAETLVCWSLLSLLATSALAQNPAGRYLYVAEPGIRNYTEYGGHGIIVLNMDHDYQFVKRIPFQGLADDGTPDNVKGICGNAETGRLYVSTKIHLICIDLYSEAVLWERQYPNGCDRMSMSPDGKIIYQPSFEKDNWYILDAESGDIISQVVPNSRAHNTVFSVDGKLVFLAGLGSSTLSIADSQTHQLVSTCGPFADSIRPFTVNGDATRCYVNINGLLGFEIGNLTTGKRISRVEVQGFKMGPVKRHGCPSHGIAMTPDQSEIWVTDGHNEHVHVFALDGDRAEQTHSIKVREQPGWLTFSLDGTTCWSSTGDVIDAKSKKITHTWTDEEHRMVMSEKVLEVHFDGRKVTAVGDQFARGKLR